MRQQQADTMNHSVTGCRIHRLVGERFNAAEMYRTSGSSRLKVTILQTRCGGSGGAVGGGHVHPLASNTSTDLFCT